MQTLIANHYGEKSAVVQGKEHEACPTSPDLQMIWGRVSRCCFPWFAFTLKERAFTSSLSNDECQVAVAILSSLQEGSLGRFGRSKFTWTLIRTMVLVPLVPLAAVIAELSDVGCYVDASRYRC